MIDEACRIVGKWELYANSGIQFMPFNTLFQLLGCKHRTPEPLGKATQLLFMPNLLMTLLGARPCAEYTIASTSQMMDMHTGQWSKKLLNALDLSIEILPEVVNPGRQIGVLNPAIARNKDGSAIPILTVGTHDTASAVAAVPAVENRPWACLSSGTWSLMGIETPSPIITPKTFEYALTNEGGVEHTIALLRNIMGLWLVQECRREWAQETGQLMDWEHIKQAAALAPPLRSIIDTDHPAFYQAGDMPVKIRDYCKKTGQPLPETVGEIARTCYESLALKYRYTLDAMGKMKGTTVTSLNIVGGGTKNRLLSQMAADATGLAVITGPVEGAAMGNALMQAMAHGEIAGIDQLRDVVRASVDTQVYPPRPSQAWEDAYGRLLAAMDIKK
jgi:rhamnulokinase